MIYPICPGHKSCKKFLSTNAVGYLKISFWETSKGLSRNIMAVVCKYFLLR